MNSHEGRLIQEWIHEDRRFVMHMARWSDLASYAAMHRELHQERVMASPCSGELPRAGELLSKRLIQADTGTGGMMLVEADGRVVAEGTLTPSNGDGSITLGLLVLDGYRDLGLGRRLMLALEDEARRLGNRRLDLTVWGANDRAYHLYTDMGYREMGRFPDWIKSDLSPTGKSDLIWMVKDLGQKAPHDVAPCVSSW